MIFLSSYLAHEIGLEPALILSTLQNMEKLTNEEQKLQKNEQTYFIAQNEILHKYTTLTAYQIRRALKTLEEHGYIEAIRSGVPSHRYVRLLEK